MNLAVVKYNAGNIQSVIYALQRLGIEPLLTDDHEALRAADKVIFPGVGEASSTMRHLRERGLDALLPSLRQPVLGICLGLQLMCRHSEEGDTPCLGIFDLEVRKFRGGLKIPHIGWNSVSDLKTPLFGQNREGDYVYFVHSYYAEVSEHTIATAEYMQPFSAALHRDNFYAMQYHPEKSGPVGAAMLDSFLKL
jgi:glutamine amidotransferase